MAVLKCKMCGGDLLVTGDSTVAECEYCGTHQTVPNVDNEKKLALFTRANKLRFVCDFDKAYGIYESIVAEFPDEAEAYWGLVLCKYGIEYVDDPVTKKKIPTCHRSSFDSIFDDSDFEQTLENADAVARRVYREEAKAIEELRKGIVEISSKEEPYDIFICYKETDENGDRTVDSLIAQDVYDELTKKGYRVFFSRITLEDKLGQEYEPYIFAALSSARIMLAFGTDYEYFNAVWVKNEWSRFLHLKAKDDKKQLIPCYKNIDAYDMPKEFAKLQAQDMGKVGAIQDLLRGIEKILPKNISAQITKETVVVQQSASNATVDSLLKRAFMFLEDGEWDSADEYAEKILDIDPENPRAYIAKLMAELRVKKQDSLGEYKKPFDNFNSYQKAIRFADDDLKQELQGFIDCINNRILEEKIKAQEARKESIYQNAKAELEENTENSCIIASELFESIRGYKDSDEMITVAIQKAKEAATREAEEEEQRNKKKELKIKELAKVRELVGTMSGMLSAHNKHLVGLKADGTVVATGKNDYGQCDVGGWSNIIAVSAGSKHTVALKGDGTVVAVGCNFDGQCDVGGWSNIIAVSAGGNYTLGLKGDGTVVAVGDNKNGQCNVKSWTNIVAVSAGYNHAVGLESDGTCVATRYIESDWFKDQGECDVYSWCDIVAISAGDRHTVGLKTDGTLVAAGYCNEKQLAEKRNIIAISAKGTLIVGLKADGTVDAVGFSGNKWDDVVAVSAGYSYVIVGLKVDGTVEARDNFKDANRWKLFDDISSLEKRREEVVRMIEQVKIKAQRCSKGVCQHCGGQLKGLLAKKCANCGKPKDY